MFTYENIIEELNNKGYNANLEVVTKNGVEMTSVVIRTEDTSTTPNIYIDEILERVNSGSMNFDIAITGIINQYKSHKNVSFDVSVLKDKDFVLSNTYIALQRESIEELVKRECGFDGIEAYLYIRIEKFEDGIGSIKLNNKLLEYAEVSEDEIWKAAEENTFKETTLKPIFSAIRDLIGEDVPEDVLENESCGLFVLSNKSMHCGASAILDKRALKILSEKIHTNKFIMIPSSRHEVLVLPDDENISLESITEMVNAVNSNEVEPIDQLGDKAYRIAI